MRNKDKLTLRSAATLFRDGALIAGRAEKAGTLRRAGGKYRVGSFIKPLNSPTRYPEYQVFHRMIADEATRANSVLRVLDVGSPKLFTLLLTERLALLEVTSLDIWDRAIEEARALAGGLSANAQSRLKLAVADIRKPLAPELLPEQGYDVAFAMSVIEHVEPNPGGDVVAMKAMAKIMKKGGALIISIPVDRELRDEHTAQPAYGAHDAHVDEGQGSFFQRVYDQARASDLVSYMEAAGMTLEECVLVTWPQDRLFRAFWRIPGTKMKGLLGPFYPLFSPRFTARSSAEVPAITRGGDLVMRLRKA